METIMKAINKNHHFWDAAGMYKLMPGILEVAWGPNWHLGAGKGPCMETIINAVNKNHHFLGNAGELESHPGSYTKLAHRLRNLNEYD